MSVLLDMSFEAFLQKCTTVPKPACPSVVLGSPEEVLYEVLVAGLRVVSSKSKSLGWGQGVTIYKRKKKKDLYEILMH